MNLVFLKSIFLSSIRESEVMFWFFLFPVLLLTILCVIFTNIGTEGIHFTAAVLDQGGNGVGSTIVRQIFDEISAEKEGHTSLFSILPVKTREEGERFLKEQRVHIFIEIPEDFDPKFSQILFFSRFVGTKAQAPSIFIHQVKVRDASSLATEIMKQILTMINGEAAKRMGVTLPSVTVEAKTVGAVQTFSMADFMFVGVVLMSFLSAGFFGLATDITTYKSEHIYKRIFATPARTRDFFFGELITILCMCAISFTLLYLYASVVFHISLDIFKPGALIYVLLACVTSIAFGLFLGSVCKTPNRAAAFGNFLFFPMQFLGGLYFPVFNLSPWVDWFIKINPVTYLAAGIRQEMGLLSSPFKPYLHYTVPLVWVSVLIGLAFLFFRRRGEEA